MAIGKIASIDHDRIRLSVDTADGFSSAPIPDEFVRIRWGHRHYLVERADVAAFCQGSRVGRAFGLLRARDQSQLHLGLPQVPREFQRFLPVPPRSANIRWIGPVTSQPVEEDGQKYVRYKTNLLIDAGKLEGVKSRMEFMSWLGHPPYQFIYAQDIEDHWSMLHYESDVCRDETFLQPAIGWQINYRPESAKTIERTTDDDDSE